MDKLENYLDTTDLKGYDPYDALNSKILKVLSLRNKWLRIAFTQGLKKFPINLRPLLLIEKGYNPKGIGLFLTAYLKLYSLYRTEKYLHKIHHLISLLERIKCDGYSGHCWGYNFDWQSETTLTPKDTPTIINTAFIAHAFLNAYELLGDERFLRIARSACDFILHDLHIAKSGDSLCFSYTPMDKSRIHNANILGAGLLAKVYSITKEEELLTYAKEAVRYLIDQQREDGSWYYGEPGNDAGFVQYTDNYHTGFVLEGLLNCIVHTGDGNHLGRLKKGLDFFIDHFFLKDGTPKYFHDRIYPIDIHCSAQAIVTLVRLKDVKDNSRLLEKVACWMVDHMQDKSGYFYYRKGRLFQNKIPYIRWSQAWAFHALTTYHSHLQSTSD
ncbi:MAG: delta-aminolevulinic acid dehydratase [Candidatus Hodarchaeota archaeon]